jgi:alcohol dehydrogenase class IV
MTVSAVHMPRTVYYGERAFDKVGEEAARFGRKALIVTDRIMDKLGYIEQCQNLLQKAEVDAVAYTGIASEPTDEYVAEALTLLSGEQCDLVIALGGGSCIDTAKAVAVLSTNNGYIGDYAFGKRRAATRPLPLIAVPTTAGTGSEATDVTVITDTATDVKMMIKQQAFLPEVAIVDPILTVSSPQHTTAATGIDALTHALEAYISRKAQPLTDMLALSAIQLITENITAAYHNGDNMEARANMAYASLQAGMAFSNASVCLVHGMSRPLGALFHVPHGISNAMLLPVVLEFSREACTDRLAEIGTVLYPEMKGVPAKELAAQTVNKVLSLCRELNIPNLRSWGIEEGGFIDSLDKMARDALASGSPAHNPRVPTQEEIIALYRQAYVYHYYLQDVTIHER